MRQCRLAALSLLLVCLGTLCLTGCKSTSLSLLEPFTPEDATDLEDVLLELEARYRLIDTLETYMKVQIKTPEGSQEVRERLLYAYPDKLRVDALGPVSDVRAVILAVGQQFTLLLVPENEAIQDTLSDQVLTEVFGVDLRISDVQSALFANPFLSGSTDDLRGERSGDFFCVQRAATRPEHVEEIGITVRAGRPQVTSWKLLDASGMLVQESLFRDYREAGGVMLPFKTTISRPVQNTTVVFEISRPKLHVDFRPNTFELNLENVRIREVSSL